MRFTICSSLLASLLSLPTTSAYVPLLHSRQISNSFTPQTTTCPKNANFLRPAKGLSDAETAFVKQRSPRTQKALTDFLSSAAMQDFDLKAFIDADDYRAPVIAIAIGGGGGVGSTLTGLGAVKALDSRERSPGAGGLGGLLQASMYIAGAGTGSWAVASLAAQEFRTVSDILKDRKGELWDFTRSLITPENRGVVETANYYEDLDQEVSAKRDSGFNVSVTDYWARALERKLGGEEMGAWSGVADKPVFKSGEMPFPIVIANVGDEERSAPEKSTVVQVSPVEIGSWDPAIDGFYETKYVGTNVVDGVPVDAQKCVTNFDSSAFIVGTSSSSYNQDIIDLSTSGKESILRELARDTIKDTPGNVNLSYVSPNPFYSTKSSTPLTTSPTLLLTDAASDGQTLPLLPLVHPSRSIDVIIALDTSSSTLYNWPDGSSLHATYARTRSLANPSLTGVFPEVPFPNTFINNNLISRPMFFGCNQTGLESPLIIYIPNHPVTAYSNYSRSDLSVDMGEAGRLMGNGYNLVTRGNGTFDEEWPACVGCAIVWREEIRQGRKDKQTLQCLKCFSEYCWNGRWNETEPAKDAYRPAIKIVGKYGAAGRLGVSMALAVGMVVVGLWMGL